MNIIRNYRYPAGFLLVSAIALLVVFVLIPAGEFIAYIRFIGYWHTAVLVLVAMVVAIPLLRGWRRNIRDIPLLWAIGLTVFLLLLTFIHGRQQPKVFTDEALLVGISLNLHLKRDASIPNQGYYINDVYHTARAKVDKRPLLFPFLLSTLHDLTGYRVANAYILNYLAAFGLSMALFGLVRGLLGWQLALSAPVLLFSAPLVPHSVNSAGFEILNLLFIVLFLQSAICFVREPDHRRLLLMVATGTLLASVRYESILYSAGIPLFFLLAARKKTAILKSPFLPVLPLFYLLPLIFLRLHFGFSHFWQMETTQATEPFSLGFIPENLGKAVYFFFNLEPMYLNSLLLSVLGSLGLVLLLVQLPRLARSGKISASVPSVILLFLGLGLLHFLLLMAYHFGDFTNSTVSRLSLPLLLHFILATALAGSLMLTKSFLERAGKWISTGMILFFLLSAPPRMALGKANLEYMPSRDMQWTLETLSGMDRETTLLVTHHGPFGVIHLYPSTSLDGLNRDPYLAWSYVENRFYDRILVVENIINSPYSDVFGYKIGEPLHEDFEYEVMAQRRMNPLYITRILAITGVSSEHSRRLPQRDRSLKPEPVQMREDAKTFLQLLP